MIDMYDDLNLSLVSKNMHVLELTDVTKSELAKTPIATSTRWLNACMLVTARKGFVGGWRRWVRAKIQNEVIHGISVANALIKLFTMLHELSLTQLVHRTSVKNSSFLSIIANLPQVINELLLYYHPNVCPIRTKFMYL